MHDIEVVATLHNNPALLEQSTNASSLTYIFFVFISVATLHVILLNVITLNKKANANIETKSLRKESYQATNLVVNLFLGIYGIYIFSNLPKISDVDIVNRIANYNENTIFAILQIGYNLWALPVGIFFVGETKVMLIHHLLVLCVAAVTCFCSNGLRYHAPFFYGVIEISSVPLAIMNYMKDNYEWTQQHAKKLYLVVRVLFLTSFLSTRVILWTPQIYDVLRNCFLLFSTCETGLCRVVCGSFWVSSVGLTLMQYYWGLLIIKMVYTLLTKGKSKKK